MRDEDQEWEDGEEDQEARERRLWLLGPLQLPGSGRGTLTQNGKRVKTSMKIVWICMTAAVAGLAWAGGSFPLPPVPGEAADAAMGSTGAGEKFTSEQLRASFYYDLGPAEIDVSSYPREQQANYSIFAKTCSQCHTLARPINAPIIKREDWKRYVHRMHLKTKLRSRIEISKEEAKTVVDFLAYDSQLRKIDRKDEFQTKTKELKALFRQVQVGKAKLQVEESKKRARQSAPYTGDKPTP